jgi:hypothetical protein
MGFLRRIKFKFMYSMGSIQIPQVRHEGSKEIGPGWEFDLSERVLSRFPAVNAITDVCAVTINGQDTKIRIWFSNTGYTNRNFVAINLDLNNPPEVTDNSTPFPMYTRKDVVAYCLDSLGFYIRK